MQYTYISAYTISGGNSVLGDLKEIELYKDPSIAILLTIALDKHLTGLERDLAIRKGFFSGLFGEANSSLFQEDLGKEEESIRAEISKKANSNTILIIKCFGEEALIVKNPIAEVDTLVVYFDDYDYKERIRHRHSKAVQAAISSISVSLNSESEVIFGKLVDGIIFKDNNNRTIHPIVIRMGTVRAIISTRIELNKQKEVSESFQKLIQKDELETFLKLYIQFIHEETDKLRAFVFGWAALEILIQKGYKPFQQSFQKDLKEKKIPEPVCRLLVSKNIGQNADFNKINVRDKFVAICYYLCSNTSFEPDFEKFKRIKELRDELYHHGKIAEASLPISELKNLLAKFLGLLLSYIS